MVDPEVGVPNLGPKRTATLGLQDQVGPQPIFGIV
jgi:hypothetical protein